MSDTKRMTLSAIILSIVALVGFLFWYVSHYSNHAIAATRDCLVIFQAKSADYFGDSGKSRFVFNKKMNTCLILNTVETETTGNYNYRMTIVDMISDDILFTYGLKKDEEKDSVHGLTHDEALDRARSYGFIIF